MAAIFYARCPLCDAAGRRDVARFAALAFVRCDGCGLVYKAEQAPALMRGYGAAYFEGGRSRYLRRFAHRVRKGERQLQAAAAVLDRAPGRVLDVGCSAGYMMQAAANLGLTGVGVDASAFAVALCRERGLTAHEAAADRLPFPDGHFDVVTMKHTLEHLVDPVAALTEVRRVLRPGGAVLLQVPDAGMWKRYAMPRRGSYFRPERAGWQHHVYYHPRHLARMAARAGLVPRRAGKAVFRRQLAHGLRLPWEALRYALVLAGSTMAAALRQRREIQLIAARPDAAAAAAQPGPTLAPSTRGRAARA